MMVEKQFQRNTPQRRAILEELKRLMTHPTAGELYEAVKKHFPKISLGTVYRNLELMTEMGVIQKLDMAGKEARYDADIESHLHVRCVHCSRVADLGSTPPEKVEYDSERTGWKILEQRLEYVGICPACLG